MGNLLVYTVSYTHRDVYKRQINYREKNGKVLSHIENFNKNDGLNSNDITYLADDNEKVFVATGKGIAVMPKNITSKKFDIKTHIISLKINEKQREIKDNYHLEKLSLIHI